MKYVLFIILGILIFIFFNNYNTFSIGVPEYLLTINNGDININLSDYSYDQETVLERMMNVLWLGPQGWAMNEDGPLSPSNPVIMVDENRYYVFGNDIDDARRNYDTYIESMQSMAGGTAGGGACSVVINTRQKLMDSYKVCDPSITDDILSQMRCMFEDGEIPECEITSSTTCHQSQRGLFPVIDKYYNPRGGDMEPVTNVLRNLRLSESYTWSRTNELLQSGGHYILLCDVFQLHSFFIEFKNKKFRIISLWQGIYGFLEFPSLSIWGNFDGHDDYNSFLDKLKIINGGDDVDLDTSGESNFRRYSMTEDQAKRSVDTIYEIFASRVNWSDEIYGSVFNNKGMFNQPKDVINLESE